MYFHGTLIICTWGSASRYLQWQMWLVVDDSYIIFGAQLWRFRFSWGLSPKVEQFSMWVKVSELQAWTANFNISLVFMEEYDIEGLESWTSCTVQHFLLMSGPSIPTGTEAPHSGSSANLIRLDPDLWSQPGAFQRLNTSEHLHSLHVLSFVLLSFKKKVSAVK